MAFVQKIASDHIEDLDAEIMGNQLITMEYRRMKKRRILGFLLALNRPINVETFLKATGVEEGNPDKMIEQLIKEGKLKGKYQNSYYIPEKFAANQKQLINNFFQNNGYIDFEMLHKKFLIPKPYEWITKNIKSKYIIFGKVCFSQAKLVSFQNQIESLVKGEGFVEISSVIPFDLDENEMERFLLEYCEVKNIIINEGYCYSESWLEDVVNEFRNIVVYDLFFKKGNQKGKKKQKKLQIVITEEELIDTLFDANLAEYSVAEDIASSLLPLLLHKL